MYNVIYIKIKTNPTSPGFFQRRRSGRGRRVKVADEKDGITLTIGLGLRFVFLCSLLSILQFFFLCFSVFFFWAVLILFVARGGFVVVSVGGLE